MLGPLPGLLLLTLRMMMIGTVVRSHLRPRFEILRMRVRDLRLLVRLLCERLILSVRDGLCRSRRMKCVWSLVRRQMLVRIGMPQTGFRCHNPVPAEDRRLRRRRDRRSPVVDRSEHGFVRARHVLMLDL